METPPSLSGISSETILKSEADYEQTTPIITSVSSVEPLVAPPSVTSAQLITVPIASAQPLMTSTPSASNKRKKRVSTVIVHLKCNYRKFFRVCELISIVKK